MEWTQKTRGIIPTGAIGGNYCPPAPPPVSPGSVSAAAERHSIDSYRGGESLSSQQLARSSSLLCGDTRLLAAHGERLITCDIRRGAAGKVSGGSSPLRADRRSRYFASSEPDSHSDNRHRRPRPLGGQLEPISSLGQLAPVDSPLRVAHVPEPIATAVLERGKVTAWTTCQQFPLALLD